MPEPDPLPPEDDLDARFEEIVAQLRAEQPSTAGDALTVGDLDDLPGAGDPTAGLPPPADPAPPRDAVNPPPVFRPAPPPPRGLDVPVWRGASGDAAYDELLDQIEAEDHYEPPPPRPLPPQEDLHFWGIIIGLVGGPLILLWLVLFRPDVSDLWGWAGAGMTIGGFVLLVLRGDDHDRGDGAVV